LKSAAGAARTEVIPAQFLEELFFAVDDTEPALYFSFGRESFATLAASFEEKIRCPRQFLLSDGLPVTSEWGAAH
jgi:hypothetical protein